MSAFPSAPVSYNSVLKNTPAIFSQTTNNGSTECPDSSSVPAVCCSAVPQQPRAATEPHPPTPRAALPTVHAAALPGPAGPATGRTDTSQSVLLMYFLGDILCYVFANKYQV